MANKIFEKKMPRKEMMNCVLKNFMQPYFLAIKPQVQCVMFVTPA